MSSWGKCDFSEFRKLAERMEKLSNADASKLYTDCAKALAARLLTLVIHKTPVGDYPEGSGKVGGTLRRGWTSSSYSEALGGTGRGGDKDKAAAWAKSLPVSKNGSDYIIEVVNPVEYASYVEFGHRKPNGGFVAPRYFLTVSENLLRGKADKIVEGIIEERLSEVFDV